MEEASAPRVEAGCERVVCGTAAARACVLCHVRACHVWVTGDRRAWVTGEYRLTRFRTTELNDAFFE